MTYCVLEGLSAGSRYWNTNQSSNTSSLGHYPILLESQQSICAIFTLERFKSFITLNADMAEIDPGLKPYVFM
jgi:hypothetical protein